MIIMVCLDDNGGMMFNRRRQSQDRVLRQRMIEKTGKQMLWMSDYSHGLFLKEDSGRITADPKFLEKAGMGEFCFVEDADLSPYADRIEEIFIYRWNRVYPADVYFPLDLSAWKLAETAEFAGSSHEKITEERYVR